MWTVFPPPNSRASAATRVQLTSFTTKHWRCCAGTTQLLFVRATANASSTCPSTRFSSSSPPSGSEEGAFAWLTLNYLLGTLGKEPSQTVAAIDLGGGSVQQAFALPADVAHAAPRSDYIMALAGGGRAYDVYVHSYLGFGLMAGRAAILQLDSAKDAHPCVPKDHNGTRRLGDGRVIGVVTGHVIGHATLRWQDGMSTSCAVLRIVHHSPPPHQHCNGGCKQHLA